MHLSQYYGDTFRRDLSDVLAEAPRTHEHGAGEITIQPRTLSLENGAIQRWDAQQRMLFASALYLSVLSDQVCYTYFRPHYPAFRELTRYPKFRGDCPGGCYGHLKSAGVFWAIGKAPGAWSSDDQLDYGLIPGDLLEVMHHEVETFFPRHLTAIDAAEFWRRCDESIPAEFRLRLMRARKSSE